MIQAIMQYRFMQYAVIGVLLASVVCGIIGAIISEKKLVMMTGGISHTAYGGIGLAYFLGFEPIIGAFFIAIMAAMTIGYIKNNGQDRSDTIIGMLWSLGMAIGILFIALSPGYPPDMSSYLFGSILAITTLDLQLMFFLTVIVVTAIVSFYQYWKVVLFDSEYALIVGLPVKHYDYFMYILIALSIVVLIRVVGIILILSMLTTPILIASYFSKDLKKRMILAMITGIAMGMLGLWISYYLNIPSGAAIVIVSSLFFMIIWLKDQIRRRKEEGSIR